jgi:NitT/TauT family transport system ATP-binding protein
MTLIPGSGARLAVSRVSKRFSQRGVVTPVVDEVSLTVGDGEVVSIFGPNGCGKSTLLHVIAGITPHDGGEVSIVGRTDQRAIGMVFQNYAASLMPWRTCAGNISLPLEAKPGLSRRERVARSASLLEELDLNLPLELYPYQMSGGQKQLSCIARALIVRPLLMLLDEPFVSLDYQTRSFLHSSLMRIWEHTRVATLVVSHDIDEAIYLAHRVVLLTARPCRVARVFEVPFPHPRPSSVVHEPAFVHLRREIVSAFAEVAAA